MTKKLNAIFQIVILLALAVVAGAQQLPDGRVSLVQDWSHRHVRYSNTATLQQRVNLMHDPRALHNYLDRVWRPNFPSSSRAQFSGTMEEAQTMRGFGVRRPGAPFLPVRGKTKNSDVDWAISLGPGGQFPTAETPAKYQFDITKPPDCTNDFVVFPINATPSATQANIIAVNNLYSGTNPTGQCGTGPTVMWSYKLGSSGTALSPALSLDGKKVAMLETSNPVKLHILTWQAGQGTSAIAPYSGTATDTVVSYTTLAGTGCSAASASDSNASPYIDYDSDSAFVSANNGIIYHIKGVFEGTPTLDYCFQVGATNGVMTSPVYDGSAGKVFLSDGATVYSVDFNPSSGFSNKKSVTVASANGITLSPIIDGASQMVYVFSASDTGNTHSIVSQIPYAMTGHVDVQTGAVGSGYVLDGTFDNNFYMNPDPTTWTLYTCGRTAAGGTIPALYGIGFQANGIMSTTPLFGPNTSINPGGTAGQCSPLQEFYNSGVDRMFISTTGSNTVSMYDITNRLTAASTATATAAGYSGGTGSFAVDNTSTNPQASSIYFGTMGSSTTTCPTTASPVNLTEQHYTNSASSSGKTLTVTISPAAPIGSMIVVGVVAQSTSATATVKDNNNVTYTEITGARKTNTNAFSDMYVTLKTTKTTSSVTITLSANVATRGAEVWVVNGFTSPVLDVVGSIGPGVPVLTTSTGASVTTTTDDEFIAAIINTNNKITANPLPGNAFTSGGDITGNFDAGASLITSAAGTYTPAWTDTGTSFSEATVAFKEGSTTTANFCAVKLTQSGLK